MRLFLLFVSMLSASATGVKTKKLPNKQTLSVHTGEETYVTIDKGKQCLARFNFVFVPDIEALSDLEIGGDCLSSKSDSTVVGTITASKKIAYTFCYLNKVTLASYVGDSRMTTALRGFFSIGPAKPEPGLMDTCKKLIQTRFAIEHPLNLWSSPCTGSESAEVKVCNTEKSFRFRVGNDMFVSFRHRRSNPQELLPGQASRFQETLNRLFQMELSQTQGPDESIGVAKRDLPANERAGFCYKKDLGLFASFQLPANHPAWGYSDKICGLLMHERLNLLSLSSQHDPNCDNFETSPSNALILYRMCIKGAVLQVFQLNTSEPATDCVVTYEAPQNEHEIYPFQPNDPVKLGLLKPLCKLGRNPNDKAQIDPDFKCGDRGQVFTAFPEKFTESAFNKVCDVVKSITV